MRSCFSLHRLAVMALALALLGVSADGRAATAQPLTPRAALERLFTSDQIDAAWFTDAFLRQVPASQVQTFIAQFRAELGPYERIEETADGFAVVFARGVVPAVITLESDGKISGLRLLAPRLRGTGAFEAAVEPFRSLPGRVSLLVLENGQERVALNADARLAVGSAFKLAVLHALRQEIAVGRRDWSDVVSLDPGWRSLPSGRLQDWPTATPLTIATLAGQMIAESDNTATDGLIDLLGRAQIEPYAGVNRPLLSTRQAFTLKNPANAELLARWRAGDEARRRTLLPEVDNAPLPTVAQLTEAVAAGMPIAPDVEWFFTARELCGLIADVADLPLTGINPGLAAPREWARIAYKGGSEPGVLNFTHFLQGTDGRRWCVVATWNNTEKLDESRFGLVVGTLIGSLNGDAPVTGGR